MKSKGDLKVIPVARVGLVVCYLALVVWFLALPF